MRISDWSSDVCSSDLLRQRRLALRPGDPVLHGRMGVDRIHVSRRGRIELHAVGAEAGRHRGIHAVGDTEAAEQEGPTLLALDVAEAAATVLPDLLQDRKSVV